jgi:hypothetical protein
LSAGICRICTLDGALPPRLMRGPAPDTTKLKASNGARENTSVLDAGQAMMRCADDD